MTKCIPCTVIIALTLVAIAQVKTEVPVVVHGAKPVAIEHIKIHGTALEGNLEKNDLDREVLVFLPPSYVTNKPRRYPVIYALHGYSIGADQWSKEIHVPQTIEGAFAQSAQEAIVVLPDSRQCTTGPCTRVPRPQATSRTSSQKTSWPTSTRIIAPSRNGRAAAASDTPWAVTAPAGSA